MDDFNFFTKLDAGIIEFIFEDIDDIKTVGRLSKPSPDYRVSVLFSIRCFKDFLMGQEGMDTREKLLIKLRKKQGKRLKKDAE